MKVLFIVLLAICIIIGMCIYLFILAITSDDLELDIETEKEIIKNYEKKKKDLHFWF